MNKAELVEAVQNALGKDATKRSAEDAVAAVLGAITSGIQTQGKVQIIAPDGFMEHAVSENLIAGPAMTRRANYQFGTSLQPGPAGQGGCLRRRGRVRPRAHA